MPRREYATLGDLRALEHRLLSRSAPNLRQDAIPGYDLVQRDNRWEWRNFTLGAKSQRSFLHVADCLKDAKRHAFERYGDSHAH